MDKVCIGRIINTHGIRGEVKIDSYSDFDRDRYRKGNTVYVCQNGEMRPLTVASHRTHKGYALVSFAGLQNINDVEQFKNCDVWFDREAREPLKEGEYYRSDLIGMTVKDTDGSVIGTVADVEETNGAQNNLRIRLSDGRTALVPYVKPFIASVDTESGNIVIRVMEGLL